MTRERTCAPPRQGPCAACSGRYGVLVIRRRLGEALLIGGEVEIEILEATASQVKLGIRGPCRITVLRKEIFSRLDI